MIKWTHNPDGSWSAHDNAKPFDLGRAKGATFRSMDVDFHEIAMGSPPIDLWTALNETCGTQR